MSRPPSTRLHRLCTPKQRRAELLEVALCLGGQRDVVELFLDTVESRQPYNEPDRDRVRCYLSALSGLHVAIKDAKLYEVWASDVGFLRGMERIMEQHACIGMAVPYHSDLLLQLPAADTYRKLLSAMRACQRSFVESMTFSLGPPIGTVSLCRWDRPGTAASAVRSPAGTAA